MSSSLLLEGGHAPFPLSRVATHFAHSGGIRPPPITYSPYIHLGGIGGSTPYPPPVTSIDEPSANHAPLPYSAHLLDPPKHRAYTAARGEQLRRVEWWFLPPSPSGSPLAIGGFIEPPSLPRRLPYFHDPSRVVPEQLRFKGGSIVHPPLVGRRVTSMTFRVTRLPRHPPSASSTFHPVDLPSRRSSTVFHCSPLPCPSFCGRFSCFIPPFVCFNSCFPASVTSRLLHRARLPAPRS